MAIAGIRRREHQQSDPAVPLTKTIALLNVSYFIVCSNPHHNSWTIQQVVHHQLFTVPPISGAPERGAHIRSEENRLCRKMVYHYR